MTLPEEPRIEMVLGMYDCPDRNDLIEKLKLGVEYNTEAWVKLTSCTRWYDLVRYCSEQQVQIAVFHYTTDLPALEAQRERTLATSILHPLPLFQHFWQASYYLAQHKVHRVFPRIFFFDHEGTLNPRTLPPYGIERQLGLDQQQPIPGSIDSVDESLRLPDHILRERDRRDNQGVVNDWVEVINQVDYHFGVPYRAQRVQEERRGNLLLSHRLDIAPYQS